MQKNEGRLIKLVVIFGAGSLH